MGLFATSKLVQNLGSRNEVYTFDGYFRSAHGRDQPIQHFQILGYIKFKFLRMSKFKDGFSSESYYPDSDYLLNQANNPEESPVFDDQISSMGENFEWPDSYWLSLIHI